MRRGPSDFWRRAPPWPGRACSVRRRRAARWWTTSQCPARRAGRPRRPRRIPGTPTRQRSEC